MDQDLTTPLAIDPMHRDAILSYFQQEKQRIDGIVAETEESLNTLAARVRHLGSISRFLEAQIGAHTTPPADEPPTTPPLPAE